MTTPGAPPISHGRGGAGNISVDEPGNCTTSTAAGTGNVSTAAIQVHNSIHSTGRGGAGNITDVPDPEPDAVGAETQELSAADDGNYHTGRGGIGNEYHAATTSADATTATTPGDNSAVKKGKGIVAKLRAKVKQALTSLKSKKKKEPMPRPEPADISASQPPPT